MLGPTSLLATLLGRDSAQLGASRVGRRLRGSRSPFGQERVAQPGDGQRYRDRRQPLDGVRQQQALLAGVACAGSGRVVPSQGLMAVGMVAPSRGSASSRLVLTAPR